LLRLGPPLTATRGWAPPELAAAYARAQELCETIDDHAQLIPALWLLATFRLGRSEHAEVDKLVGRLLRLVEQTGDPSLLALASLQVSPFYQGKFVEARRLLERASAAPDVREQHELALRFGIAPAVLGLAYLAECLWLTGFPDQASRSSREARQLAEQIQLPMVTCYAMARSCWLAAMQGKIEDVRSYAATLGQVAQTFGMQNFVLAAQFFQHWAAVEGGTPDSERITSMTQAIEDYCSTGTLLNRTGFLVFFGQACSRAGQFARGLDAVDESLALAEQTEELWFQAEAWRVKGELLRRQSAGQRHPEEVLHAAGTCFERARQVARQQQARWLELRAVVSLCMLWQSQSQGKGLDLLAEIVDQLSEGLDTPEMRQASTLLQRVIAPLS